MSRPLTISCGTVENACVNFSFVPSCCRKHKDEDVDRDQDVVNYRRRLPIRYCHRKVENHLLPPGLVNRRIVDRQAFRVNLSYFELL